MAFPAISNHLFKHPIFMGTQYIFLIIRKNEGPPIVVAQQNHRPAKQTRSLNMFSSEKENGQPDHRDSHNNGHCVYITTKFQPFHRKAFFSI